ncbi:MAG: response regulator [Myxococcales bacterium]|nr:response regulator [Myxococcales bacterium]
MSFNVLIVDDSAVMRRMVRRALATCELPMGQILEASDGEQALQVLSDSWIDLVLTDINMPHMGGHAMLEAMNESDELGAIATIVVTSEKSTESIERARAVGANGYLIKPFRPDELRAMVENALGSVC